MEILCINLKSSKLIILWAQAAFLQEKTNFLWKRSRLRTLNTNSTLLRPVSLRSQFPIFENSAKKNLHYFRKTIYCRCWAGLWICLKYTKVLNISGFWICQGSKYAKFLNIPGFWIYQGSEYARVLNMPGFWIFQGSE